MLFKLEMRVLSFDIGVYNLAYCVGVADQLGQDHSLNAIIEDWQVVCLKDKSDPNDFTFISKALVRELHTCFNEEYFDVVLIENQPCMKNPVMKSIQMIIYSFFQIKAHSDGQDLVVKLVSASNKLKVLHKCDTSHITDKDKYKRNKKTAIAYMRNYLEKGANSKWLDTFNKEKKQDDLSDCGLMIMHFIETNTAL
jgi:hypothetical protein